MSDPNNDEQAPAQDDEPEPAEMTGEEEMELLGHHEPGDEFSGSNPMHPRDIGTEDR
ncbi:hypothetical protein [uncultured Jatrophihabitans sp.]|uniref:hypothetical protein n=1 Tax=uncultured Jatrophihabitans sp. TaxID=1610747 RepID=UPI0035CB6A24